MLKPVLTSSFSATDAAFFYLERKEIPLHIASVCIFDGPIPFQRFLTSVKAKLHLVPRYTQIPSIPASVFSYPTWKPDPRFDILRHVIPVKLRAPGGEAELQELAGRIFSRLLDRTKPLWDVHVVEGLQDGRGALIWRVHHALADGVSGAELMKILLDPTPEVSRTAGRPRTSRIPPEAPEPPLAKTISGAVQMAVRSVLELEAGLLDFTEHLLKGNGQGTAKGLAELLPEYSASIERLPFNKPCTGARKFCWTEWDLAEVQAIREAARGTVNDIVLAVLTRALARYVKWHGQSVVNRFVRIVCPVNLRQSEEHPGLGNSISFLPVAIPMDARGPLQMVHAVARRTETLKKSGALRLAALAAQWFTAAPPPIQAFFWRNIPDLILPFPVLNMICTNVVGSPKPLYAAGRRMVAAYPQVPTGYELGVGCAVHSYDGKLFFGFIADTEAAPDVERLRDFLISSFQELRDAAARKRVRNKKGGADSKPEARKELVRSAQAAAVGSPGSPTLPVDARPLARERTGEAA